ncbi:MAG: hypothetical protein D6696_16545, partial [Acidobacteria bacterium]
MRAPQIHFFVVPVVGPGFAFFNLSNDFAVTVPTDLGPDQVPNELLLPTAAGEPLSLEGWNLRTNERVFQDILPPPDQSRITLPAGELYGDATPPVPAGGSPVRFFLIEPSGSGSRELAPGLIQSESAGRLTIQGDDGVAPPRIDVHLAGLDDAADARAQTTGDGFSLSIPATAGKRYLLAIGARVGPDDDLEIRFSEGLNRTDGIEIHDDLPRPTGVPLDVALIGTGELVRLRPASGWQAGQTYTVRLTTGLRDAAGNPFLDPAGPRAAFDVQIEARTARNATTFDLGPVRDVARMGSLLFAAGETQGLMVIDASDPANLKNYLPGNLRFPLPLNEPVKGVDVDPHGRVVFVGGGVSNFGLAVILDALAIDPQSIDLTDPAWREPLLAGTTILSDPFTGTQTQLREGRPRRIAILSNDQTDEWLAGDPPPAGLTVTPAVAATGTTTLTLSGSDGSPGLPVSLRNLSRGTHQRVDAGPNGTYVFTLGVRPGDRLHLARNRASYAYVTIDAPIDDGFGLVIADVNRFYREDVTAPEPAAGLLRYAGGFTVPEPAEIFCNPNATREPGDFIDVAILQDDAPGARFPFTVFGLAHSFGLWMLKPKANDLGDVDFLNGQCGEVDGVKRMGGMDVVQRYPMTFIDAGGNESVQLRDYAVMTNVTGTVLIVDVTDRENIFLASQVRLPGQAGKVTVDRQRRRILVSGRGAGIYVVAFDRLSRNLLDENGDGQDDRLIETILIPGEDVAAPPIVVPELGIILAGGVARGMTSVALDAPELSFVIESEGRLQAVDRLAPFGVPTAP